MKYPRLSAGFTAVELLITIFIGASFILIGYQLYTVVIVDGAAVRDRAAANNVAADYVKRKVAGVAACPGSPIPATETPPGGTGLRSLAVTSNISAPYGCSGSSDVSNVVRVEVKVQYKNQSGAQEEVVNVGYLAL